MRSFLLSSALFWLDHYHIDGLRVDAVASMLYRDYSRSPGEWIPNEYGGRENLETVSFLRQLNEVVYGAYPDVQTIAEESTAWPMVSRPTYLDGLGFGMKWDMGWMHDTLRYLERESVHRSHHHHELTFRMIYAFNDNFMLPLSHDEVVHGKGSLLAKMPGDEWQQRANLRLLLGYMFAQPGKKLLFMGSEIGQWSEWSHEGGVDWNLLADETHAGLRHWVRDLNLLYGAMTLSTGKTSRPPGSSGWRAMTRLTAYSRSCATTPTANRSSRCFNCTPVPRENYRVGVPRGGH